jgi:uncharacterized protein YegL
MLERPGGRLAARPLHFFFVADCSGSMAGDKIQSLNQAIREAIPAMRAVAAENPNAAVLVRALRFSNGAQWHIPQATPVDQFEWIDLTASGQTDMGKALTMIADELRMPPMTERALPPVIVLVSDGQPTDDFEAGLRRLNEEPWGKKAVRIAIAIGHDADEETLREFVGNNEIPVLRASNPEALTAYIKWASTVVVKSVSSPPSVVEGSVVHLPVPVDSPDTNQPDVW